MQWPFTVGRIAGTAIRIHITFLLFLVWIVASNYASGGLEAAKSSIVFVLLVFACVVAHEFGHIPTARKFGVKTPEVTLLPIGGVANMERIASSSSNFFTLVRHQHRNDGRYLEILVSG